MSTRNIDIAVGLAVKAWQAGVMTASDVVRELRDIELTPEPAPAREEPASVPAETVLDRNRDHDPDDYGDPTVEKPVKPE